MRSRSVGVLILVLGSTAAAAIATYKELSTPTIPVEETDEQLRQSKESTMRKASVWLPDCNFLRTYDIYLADTLNQHYKQYLALTNVCAHSSTSNKNTLIVMHERICVQAAAAAKAAQSAQLAYIERAALA